MVGSSHGLVTKIRCLLHLIEGSDGQTLVQKVLILLYGSGCGSVGRAVASDTRGPRYESSHWRNFIINMFTVNC